MSQDDQIIDLTIVGGQDEKVDRRLAVKPLALVNCRYAKDGGLEKRPGSVCRTPGDGFQNIRDGNTGRFRGDGAPGRTVQGPPCTLASDGQRLLRLSRGEIDSVMVTQATLGYLAGQDTLGTHFVEREPIVSGEQYDPQVASTSSYLFVAYVTGAPGVSTTWVECRVAATLNLLWKFSITGGLPRIVAAVVSGAHYVFLTYVVGTSLNALRIPALINGTFAQPIADAGGTVDANSTTRHDLVTDGTNVYTFHETNTGAVDRFIVTRYAMDFTGATTSAFGGVDTGSEMVCMALGTYNGGVIYAGYSVSGGGTRTVKAYARVKSTLAASWGPTTLASIGSIGSIVYGMTVVEVNSTLGTAYWAFGDVDGVAVPTGFYQASTRSTGTMFAAAKLSRGVAPWSKAFLDALGNPCLYLIQTDGYSGLFKSYFLYQGAFNPGTVDAPHNPAQDNFQATIAPLQVYGTVLWTAPQAGRTLYHPASVCDLSRTRIEAPGKVTTAKVAGIITGAPVDPSVSYQGVTCELAIAEPVHSYGTAFTQCGLVIGDGVPCLFDGARAAELGFPWAPATPSLTAGAGGALTPNATYSYIAVWSHTDRRGAIDRSPISTSAVVALSAVQNRCTVVIKELDFTKRLEDGKMPFIELYRTEANGSTFYLTALVQAAFGGSTTIVDDTDDATLRRRPTLYTTGGVLERHPPPSSRYAVYALERVWLLGTDNDAIWYSTRLLEGERPGFNLESVIQNFAGGRVTGGAELDSFLIIFKQYSIYALSGDGPDDTGNGSFSPLTQVASDIGCVDARSIVRIPEGILFMSSDGLAMVTRSLQVIRIGRPVEDTMNGGTPETFVQVSAAVNTPDLGEVRFYLQRDAGTREQRAVVFRVQDGVGQGTWAQYQWSSHGVVGGVNAVSACNHRGGTNWILNNGHVIRDEYTTSLDGYTVGINDWCTMQVDLAPFKFGGVQNYGRTKRVGIIGEKKTDHDLSIELFADYSETPTQTIAVPHSQIAALDREQLQHVVAEQKAQAYRVRITDATPTGGTVGTGKGVALSGITFRVASKSGMRRRPPSAG